MNKPHTPQNMAATTAITTACAQLQLAASPTQVEGLVTYLTLLQKWNKVYNLTALRDPSQMLTHHIYDCLAVLPPLMQHFQRLKQQYQKATHPSTVRAEPVEAPTDTSRTPRILDVGSGAGLPGLVIALFCPQTHVTCVDAVDKKMSFVRQAAIAMGLKNLTATHARVETLADAPNFTPFDLITSRAFATLTDFYKLTLPLIAPQGAWMAMKGQHPQDEINALPKSAIVFHVEPLQVPQLDAARCLVWMQTAHA